MAKKVDDKDRLDDAVSIPTTDSDSAGESQYDELPMEMSNVTGVVTAMQECQPLMGVRQYQELRKVMNLLLDKHQEIAMGLAHPAEVKNIDELLTRHLADTVEFERMNRWLNNVKLDPAVPKELPQVVNKLQANMNEMARNLSVHTQSILDQHNATHKSVELPEDKPSAMKKGKSAAETTEAHREKIRQLREKATKPSLEHSNSAPPKPTGK